MGLLVLKYISGGGWGSYFEGKAIEARTFAAALLFTMDGSFVAQFHQVAQAQNPAGTRGQRQQAYPDRPKAPQEVLDRGRATYGVSCAFCHGSDAGGGEIGPNLLRSEAVLEDQSGELMAPIIHGSRADKGMPRIDVTDAQISDIAAWIHSLKVASRTDPATDIDIVRGNAKGRGSTTFRRHSATMPFGDR